MRPRFPLVAALFLVSGATGLLYEVAFSKLLGYVFGATAYAVRLARAHTGRPHVVKFSGLGAGVADTAIQRQHAETDALLQASGLPYTILRPNSFFQNLLLSAGTIKDHGAFYLPMRDGKQSLVDVRDVATVAVKVLTEPGHEGQVYEITGPESLSYAEVAATLSRVLGRPVRYVDVPPEVARDSMLRAGMPPWNERSR